MSYAIKKLPTAPDAEPAPALAVKPSPSPAWEQGHWRPEDAYGIELLEPIGQGTHAVVYRGVRQGEPLAVKVLHQDVAQAATAPVWREAAVLARLDHPALPKLRCVGEVGCRQFIAMEYVEGRSLSALLEGDPLPQDRIVSVGLQLARALEAIHAAQLIHGDVKPGNVLLDADNRLKLVDFGLSRNLRRDEGAAVGTLRYAPPEQIGTLKRQVDGRSDLYSVGIILFEMACGRLPFDAADPGEIARQHTVVIPPSVRDINPRISPALAGIIAKLLAKDPDDRYSSGRSLATDLQGLPALDEELAGRRSNEAGAGSQLSSSLLDQAPRLKRSPGALRLVGRDRQLSQLETCWEQVRRRPGRSVLLRGVSGLGKSRLASELMLKARDDGALLLASKCVRGDPTPFAALRQLVELLLDLVDCGEVGIDASDVIEACGEGGVYLKRLAPRLALLLDHIGDLDDDVPVREPLLVAAAELLLRLASRVGGAVVLVDDVQWVDEGTLAVLAAVAERLGEAPLMLLCLARDDDDSADGLSAVQGALGNQHLQVAASALETSEVEELMGSYLRGTTDDPKLAERLWRRTAGNPMAVLEYLHAMLDNGLLRYRWGEWHSQADGLETLDLPTDLVAIMGRRIAALEPATRQALVVAALIGTRFQVRLLAEALGQTELAAVTAQLDVAQTEQVIEPSGQPNELCFVHDSVRDALLEHEAPEARAEWHRRIALAYGRTIEHDDEDVYARAQHLFAGCDSGVAEEAMAINRRAGRAALDSQAPEQAYRFYRQATQLADRFALAVGPELEHGFGLACIGSWRVVEARRHFEAAAAGSDDPLLCASSRNEVAKTCVPAYVDRAHELSISALADLGLPHPRVSLLSLLRTLLVWLVGLARNWRPRRRPNPESMGRDRLLADIYVTIALISFYRLEPLSMLQAVLLMREPVMRLGRSRRELPLWTAAWGATLAALGLARPAETATRRALQQAHALADPALDANTRIAVGLALDFLKRPVAAAEQLSSTLTHGGKWLTVQETTIGLGTLIWNLYMRGLFNEAERWGERLARLCTNHSVQGDLAWLSAIPPTIRDDTSEKEAQLLQERARLEREAAGPYAWTYYLGVHALAKTSNEQFGAQVAELVERFRELKISPRDTSLQLCAVFVAAARFRLHQLKQAEGTARPAARRRYRRALRELRQVAGHPTLRAHLLLLEADQLLHDGKVRAFEARLSQTKRLAQRHDNLWMLFDAIVLGARALRQQRLESAAKREAERAIQLANEQSWSRWAQRVREEFDLRRDDTASTTSLVAQTPAYADVSSIQSARTVQALLQVSLASTTVTDSSLQIRLALDEVVKVLGAERGLLFLTDADGVELALAAGRDKDGQDLTEDKSYSRSVVRRVAQERAPQVSSADQDGALLRSESAVAYGLRSLMAVPLMLRDRLLGVVYVDNSLARGVFTSQDLDVLAAIANHIAIALETSRTARLEATVEAERAQRTLGEHLRAATTAMTSCLDTDKVVEAGLTGLRTLVPYRRATILMDDGTRLAVAAHRGFDAPPALQPARSLDEQGAATQAQLTRIMETRDSQVLQRDFPIPHHDADPRTHLLVVTPLVVTDSARGLLLVETERGSPETSGALDLVETFAPQLAMALDNARLFGQVHRQATVDGLTGAFNRRHFFDIVAREIKRTHRDGRPLSVLMLDADHFKRINDTHGHGAGDDVLVQLTERVKRSIREVDSLGRYGGEEFAVVMIGADEAEAASGAERIRRLIEDKPIQTRCGPISVTVSVGVASQRGAAANADELFQQADAALYAAKEAGRNRAVRASTLQPRRP